MNPRVHVSLWFLDTAEGSGKTTLALHAMAEVLKGKEGQAAFIDAEHALDVAYASRLGIEMSSMFICQPESGEQALEVADKLIRSGVFSVICVDSVSALVPKSELEGEVGMTQIGAQARLMSQALRKISGRPAGVVLLATYTVVHRCFFYYAFTPMNSWSRTK